MVRVWVWVRVRCEGGGWRVRVEGEGEEFESREASPSMDKMDKMANLSAPQSQRRAVDLFKNNRTAHTTEKMKRNENDLSANLERITTVQEQ